MCSNLERMRILPATDSERDSTENCLIYEWECVYKTPDTGEANTEHPTKCDPSNCFGMPQSTVIQQFHSTEQTDTHTDTRMRPILD